MVLTHLSRRTNLTFARQEMAKKLGRDKLSKIEFLMDHRFNKERYERQLRDAGEHPDQTGIGRPRGGPGGGGGGGFRGRPGGGGGGGGRGPAARASGPGGPTSGGPGRPM
jgi:hypothetical protein